MAKWDMKGKPAKVDLTNVIIALRARLEATEGLINADLRAENTALREKLATAEALIDGGRDECAMAIIAAERAEVLALRAERADMIYRMELQRKAEVAMQDRLHGEIAAAYAQGVDAGLERAAVFCHYNSVCLQPRVGYVMSEWTEEHGGKHPGMAYAAAIRAMKGQTE